MDYLVVGAVALAASSLTLFSGFGLGTLLLPAFALYFDLPVAVALTAVVHLANNLFKLGLVGLKADRGLVARFGLPALAAALAGAWLLGEMGDLAPVAEYALGGRSHRVTPVGLAVGALMIVFALFEIVPSLQRVNVAAAWLPVGGALSGFIGGVSGHQGALRSAFLIRFREALTRESFIATNVVIAVMVDLGRLSVYAAGWKAVSGHVLIAVAATACAFAGAWLGAQLIPKVTMSQVRKLVAALLVLSGLGVASGILGR